MQELSLSTHLLYRDKKFEFLVLWRNNTPSSQVDVFPEKVRNLKGRPLRIFTFNHPPSVFSDVDSKGFLHNVSGIDIEVIKAMGQALNFNPVFEHPGPELWGTILPNGTHTGMIGRISRDEAEIGVGNVFVTEVRAKYITFTIPYDYDRACFITPAPRELPKSKAILSPFSLNVWIVFTVTVLALSLFVPLFAMGLVQKDRNNRIDVSSAFLAILSNFCNQSVTVPQTPAFQVLFAFITLCGFVSTVFYSTNLTAFMLVRAVEAPYTSIEQIVKAGFQVGGFSDFWKAIFEESANENVRKLGDRFFSFFPDITPYLKRVVSREVVLLENTQHLEYLQKTFYTNRAGQSPLRLMLEECINPFGIGALLRRHSPLKKPLDMAILHMREGGLVDKFFDMVLQEDHKNVHEEFDLGFDPNAESLQHNIQALTFQHLQGAFMLLGIGVLIALTALATELLYSVAKLKRLGC
ncbi:ionotropic receptor 21a-like isoform X1 [Macrobrachium rosenbergii]|uniref:ionotropic receptor 21a-like isoform X1 n=2 Tax=Macrobrachium rosenbergii TaxID=79674 RepID=UPI0034D3D054